MSVRLLNWQFNKVQYQFSHVLPLSIVLFSAEEAVFARFDKVLLLETGRVAYYGEVNSLRGCLKQLGFACPEGRGNTLEKG